MPHHPMTTESTDWVRPMADEDLIPLLARKDASAFEVIYDRHGGAAFSLAFRILGDRSRAEDAAQEGFLSLWRGGGRYDRTRGSVRNWILAIVRNRAVDLLRREAVQRTDGRVDANELLAELPGSERTEAEALRRDAAQQLRTALDVLPEEQAAVVRLAYFGGFTHAEIADMLDMPLGTVKGRMRLGLEKMRGQLVEAVG